MHFVTLEGMQTVTLETLPHFIRDMLGRPYFAKASKGERATVLALSGELGAGKTTFVQALARELGVRDVVQSPTYVLMKSYPIAFGRFTKLVHIDAFRLESPEQFAALQPEQFLGDPAALVCIEWPERLLGALPKPDITVRLSADGTSSGERYIEVV